MRWSCSPDGMQIDGASLIEIHEVCSARDEFSMSPLNPPEELDELLVWIAETILCRRARDWYNELGNRNLRLKIQT